MPPTDPFENVDWEDLHKRLLAVAVGLSTLLSHGKLLSGTGFSAEDLVNDTILKALGGDEIRYRAERGQLFQLLKTAMIRDFLDLRRKRSHQRSVHVDLTSSEAEKDARLRDRPEEGRQKAAAFLQDIRRLVQHDPKLAEYVDAVDLGCITPAEIADVCGVDVIDIYERRRKLKLSIFALFAGRMTK